MPSPKAKLQSGPTASLNSTGRFEQKTFCHIIESVEIYNSSSPKLLKLKRFGIIFRNIFLTCTALVVSSIIFDKNIKQILSGEGYQVYETVMIIIFIIGFLSLLVWMVLLIYKLLSSPSRRRIIGVIFLVLWLICTAVVVLALTFDQNIRAILSYSAYRKIGNIFGPFFIVGLFSFFAWIFLFGNKLVRILGGLLIAVIVLFFFLTDPNKINGDQMQPALLDKSYLLTNKVIYRLSSPKRGDIIIYRSSPSNEEFIGRVVGLPGEEITVVKGSVKINGKVLQEPYVSWDKYTTLEPTSFRLNADEYWAPFDSRLSPDYPVSVVNKKDIRGKIFYVYWPPSRRGFIK